MNFCTKCASYYQTPGTCNCYAPAQQAAPTPPTYPWYPWYPTSPTVIPWSPITPTITWGTLTTAGIGGTIGNDPSANTVTRGGSRFDCGTTLTAGRLS